MIRIIVVLYNKAPADSDTLKSLGVALSGLRLTDRWVLHVHNNGPQAYPRQAFDVVAALACEVSQTSQNLSLSQIYNQFSDDHPEDAILILDDDTIISVDYLAQCIELSEGVLLPSLCKVDVRYSPNYKFGLLNFAMSGIMISRTSHSAIRAKHGSLVDGRFDFYGVDWTLARRIQNLSLPIVVGTHLQHNKSKPTSGDSSYQVWRRRQVSKSIARKIKFYGRDPRVIFLQLRIILLDIVLLRNSFSLKNLITEFMAD